MKEDDFNNLTKSIKQAGKIKNGQLTPGRTFEFNPMDIKAIRNKLHKSQSEFALMIGVSVSTLQNWEQGQRNPDGPARALLKVASENPEAVKGTTNIRAKMHSKRISSLDTAFRQKGQPQYLVVGLFLNYYGLIAII